MTDTCTCPASKEEVEARNLQGFKQHYLTGEARVTQHATHYEDCPLFVPFVPR